MTTIFLDIKKAFDNLEWPSMFMTMKKDELWQELSYMNLTYL